MHAAAIVEDLEQVAAILVVERDAGEIVEHQELGFGQGGDELGVAPVAARRAPAQIPPCRRLGVEAVDAGKSVYFATLAELISFMAKAESEGRLAQRVRFFARNTLLIVDEIGYLLIGSNGGNLFFQLANACYERCAMILTSNRSFGEWGGAFGETTPADPTRRRPGRPPQGVYPTTPPADHRSHQVGNFHPTLTVG